MMGGKAATWQGGYFKSPPTQWCNRLCCRISSLRPLPACSGPGGRSSRLSSSPSLIARLDSVLTIGKHNGSNVARETGWKGRINGLAQSALAIICQSAQQPLSWICRASTNECCSFTWASLGGCDLRAQRIEVHTWRCSSALVPAMVAFAPSLAELRCCCFRLRQEERLSALLVHPARAICSIPLRTTGS